MRKIVYTTLSGTLAVVLPVINDIGEEDGFTEAQAEQRAWDKLPQDAINPRWANELEVPTDRTFRAAWEDNAGIKVNMPKAREIHKDKLRELRKPLLEALDLQYMRADEIVDSAEKANIAAKKQALRDITATPAIEAAKTPDELKIVGVPAGAMR